MYMKDVESAESKEKSNFRIFRFIFFEVMVYFGPFRKIQGDCIAPPKSITRKLQTRPIHSLYTVS